MKEKLEQYIKNTAAIRGLSTPQLNDIDNAAQYSRLLRDNFIHIGDLAQENRAILDEWLFPFLREEKPLQNDEMEILGEFGDSLLDAYNLDNLDPAILSLLCEKLSGRVEERHSDSLLITYLDREIMACYTMVNMTSRLLSSPEIAEHYRERGFAAGRRLLAYLEPDRFRALPDDDTRAMVIINARYLWVLFERKRLSEEEARYNFAMLERALALAGDPFYREQLPGYDWRNHEFRTIQYMALAVQDHNLRGFPQDVLERVADRVSGLGELWESDPAYYGQLATKEEVAVMLAQTGYECGRISREEYYERLLALYAKRDVMDYDLSGMILNLNIPSEYLLSLDVDTITEQEYAQVDAFYHNIIHYAYHMPNGGSFSYMLEYMSSVLHNFIEVPGLMSFEELCLNSMAALHPPTFVHSMMVGRITRCLTRHLLRIRPELLAPLVEEFGSEDAVIGHAYHAAVCHDVGKIPITDTIFIYGRKLLDEEFGLIKRHPANGADMLAAHESTRRYADIARGHHRWHDNTAGYPEDFDTRTSPDRVLIDIVTCADCLDAATDTVGRSYNTGKTPEDFLEELKAQSGTRYAPFLVELFEDETVRGDLTYLIGQGRQEHYQSTYLLLKNIQEKAE